MTEAFSKSIWWFLDQVWLATLEPFAHIFTFLTFLFPGAKRPSSFTNVVPRTCGAGNFVDDVALIYFFGTKFGSREFLLECFKRFIGNLYVLFFEQPR